MLTYDQLLKNRRSIRKFTDEPVSPTVLQEILVDACKAPSASNGQPWNFIVIHNRDLMKRLSDESKKNLLQRIQQNPSCEHKAYMKILSDPTFNVFYNAPTLVMIAGKNAQQPFFQADCALCACYLMFAAVERNLGTCWIGLGQDIIDQNLRKEIGLPDDFEIAASIILGHPLRIPKVYQRKPPTILKTIL